MLTVTSNFNNSSQQLMLFRFNYYPYCQAYLSSQVIMEEVAQCRFSVVCPVLALLRDIKVIFFQSFKLLLCIRSSQLRTRRVVNIHRMHDFYVYSRYQHCDVIVISLLYLHVYYYVREVIHQEQCNITVCLAVLDTSWRTKLSLTHGDVRNVSRGRVIALFQKIYNIYILFFLKKNR